MEMKITEMKKTDFNSVPHRKHWDDKVELFNSLVIILENHLHDSGYLCMTFYAVDVNDEPICLLSGCSDVLHVDGIGGYGEFNGEIAKSRPIEGWSIDCLPCGYLRISCNGWIGAGHSVSDFEIFYHDRSEKKRNTDRFGGLFLYAFCLT